MISKLRLKFGRAPGLEAESIAVTPVTVFVGPNNSGKSKVLSEIGQYCYDGRKNALAVVLDDLEFVGLSPTSVLQTIEHCIARPESNDRVEPGHVLIGRDGRRYQITRDNFKRILENPSSDPSLFCAFFLSFNTLTLDGKSRIDLVNEQPTGDLQRPESSLQVLFRDDAKRREVRRIVQEAFRFYFVIDPTRVGQLRVRLSSRAPKDDMEERGLHEAAVQFHAQAQQIEIASDGVKAFTGIITALIAGDPRVVIIDEPEAFLHPSLAFKLGVEVSRAAATSDKKVFVSTHSPQFVRGCIQSGTPVNIVRLTYSAAVATARLLPSVEILELMRNPLLRSTGVLSGLFYEFVVVTESDADRAFYEEINERLLRFKPEWGIPNCLFINAQNKQTVQTIIRPLRKLGIPIAGIVDIDVLKDGGKVWTSLLASASVPQLSHTPLGAQRESLKHALENTGRDMKKDGGIAILGEGDREAGRNLLNQIREYGIFVIPGGELESWLKPLGAVGHGPPWLISIFEKMGEDAEAANYVKPSDNDVWEFLSHVRAWLVDPKRKGIPT